MIMKKRDKKGLSPVVATMLLVMIVIVIAVIVFLWFKSFTQEAVTKDLGFGEENVELVCDEIIFKASYSDGKLKISNDGNVPIENFDVKKVSGNGYERENLDKLVNLDVGETTRVRQGKTKNFDVNLGYYDEVIVIPILRGMSDSGEKDFTCDERYGIKVV